MKAMVCEMCNSKDFVKQDGFYVCQECGAKYSPEDAKKLMVEVEGEAGVSKKMANLYERARKSLEVDDLEHAAEYYKQILDENPDDWEAYFYSYLGETTTFTNAQAGSVAAKLGKTIPPSYDMAIKDCEPKEAEERIKTITDKTTERLLSIALTGVALLSEYEDDGSISIAKNQVRVNLYTQIWPTAQGTVASCVFAFEPLEKKIKEISEKNEKIDKNVFKECLLTICKTRFQIANTSFKRYSTMKPDKMFTEEKLNEYAEKIKELEPDFEVPKPAEAEKKAGCYVATAVYGSYDCPQVWTLRRYRDYTLAETWYGRAFISAYYFISPTLVKWFGDTGWFKKFLKPKLDRMVEKLNKSGVENTPYNDRNW